MSEGLILSGMSQAEMLGWLTARRGEIPTLLEHASSLAAGSQKQRVFPYQAAALYYLASQYQEPGAKIVEIGTYYGYTAAILGIAAPRATVITLNSRAWEWEEAVKNLRTVPNVRCLCTASWDYLKCVEDESLDFVFVDGDHKRIRLDLPWWEKVKPGGMMVFHDFTPLGAPRHCPVVYQALIEMAAKMEQAFDVLVVDDQEVGMAGWVKRLNREGREGRKGFIEVEEA